MVYGLRYYHPYESHVNTKTAGLYCFNTVEEDSQPYVHEIIDIIVYKGNIL